MPTHEVNQADGLVKPDPEVMGGMAVFAGMRVPVSVVLGPIAAGIPLDRLIASYPFLTEAHPGRQVVRGRTSSR